MQATSKAEAETFSNFRVVGKLVGYHTSDQLGACHADDLFYIFSSALPVSILSEPRDEEMSKVMVDLWANFATHRNPMAEGALWRRAAGRFTRLDSGRLVLDADEWAEKRLAFWEKLEKVLYGVQ